MDGWLWWIIGAVVYVLILLFVWALCRAAGKEDERRGYK